ncbi:MAG: FAD-binding oxidoreductase [Pseudomonadota bacterium]
MRPPPGMQEAAFREALQDFANVVGDDWVFSDPNDTKLYSDPYSPRGGLENDLWASAAVAPDSTEQVQEIMRIANRHKVPIYAFSTGKNLGYGGSAPVHAGSVMLDLKRMNRIIEINEKRHYAIVEPGVTLFDLYHAIQERGYKLSMEMMDPGWGSVIGNALDHGCAHTTTYGRDRFHDHCGMEVVLPSGELVRLGMGALPNSGMSAQFHYGFGPFLDGMFSQSNFGVVTQMGFQLRPEHEAYRSGLIQVPKFDDLEALIDVECHVTHSGIANGMTHFGSPVQGPPMGAAPETMMKFMRNPELMPLLDVKGRPDAKKLEDYAARKGIGFWSADIKFHGPEEVIKAQWEYCKAKFEEIPGAWAKDHGPVVTFPLTNEQEAKLNTEGHAEKVHLGVPSMNRFSFQQFMNDVKSTPDAPATGHLFFAPLIPKNAESLLKAQDVFYQAHQDFGIPTGPGFFGRMPIGWYYRSFIYLMGFNISTNKEVNKRAEAGYREMINIAASYGWGEYRTHAIFQDDVMNVYDFNNNALRRLNETIKDAIDPNGILAAGKSGIWPKHLRS